MTPVEGVSGLLGINESMALFVIPCGKGYSSLGFDYANKLAKAVAEWLKRPDLNPTERGTVAAFKVYQAAMVAGQDHWKRTGERCPAELTPALIGLEGARVEVTYPDGATKRFYVGHSTGWLPCHLEILTSRSHGGAAVYYPAGSSCRVIRYR